MVEDESTDLFFGEKAVSEGIGPQTRDQYLRTLIRNTYNYHMICAERVQGLEFASKFTRII